MMDPTGGIGIWLIVGFSWSALFIFAPLAWAIFLSVTVAVVIVGFLILCLRHRQILMN